MKNTFFLKLGILLVGGFGLLIAGFYAWKPLTIAYYKYGIGSSDKEAHIAAVKYLLEADAIAPVKYFYENKYASKDVHERLAVVDELCALGENGKKLMYDLFRARCMREQVLIPAGSFMMGSENGNDDEKPVHKVTLDSFWMDKYEVTNEKYYVFMKSTNKNPPEYWQSGQISNSRELHPVVCVSWEDAKLFSDWLEMRLPTEAEWEYACRSASTTEYCFGDFGDNDDELSDYAWFKNNANFQTHAIGQKKTNRWGIFDMHGNISEWCIDWYGKGYYSNSPIENPKGPNSGGFRVLRGGNWFLTADLCSSANRQKNYIDTWNKFTGFRVCRSAGK